MILGRVLGLFEPQCIRNKGIQPVVIVNAKGKMLQSVTQHKVDIQRSTKPSVRKLWVFLHRPASQDHEGALNQAPLPRHKPIQSG